MIESFVIIVGYFKCLKNLKNEKKCIRWEFDIKNLLRYINQNLKLIRYIL
jgi:hypothetical protein